MNERIRELMNQTGVPTSIPFDQWCEKFAELIVRECAEVCMKEIDIEWAMAPKSPWMAKQILEHFGLE
jgi:hypothetical protein